MGTADDVVAKSRARGDGINSQRVTDPSFDSTERSLRGYRTPQQMDDLAADLGEASPITPGDELALNARAGGDDIGNADKIRAREELSRGDILGDRIAGRGRSINETRESGEAMASKLVMRELGEPVGERLTSANYKRLRGEIGQQFDDAAEAAGDLDFAADDLAKLEDTAVRANADDVRLTEKYIEDIKADIDKNGGTLSTKDAAQYRTQLGKDIQTAAQRGESSRAGTLGDVQDVLDDIVERQIPDDVSESLADARYKWRIIKSLDRTATTDPGGNINLRSFMTSMQSKGNRFGRSSGRGAKGEEFYSNLETLRYLTERVSPSSGTAERLRANAGKAALGTLVTAGGGAGLLGN